MANQETDTDIRTDNARHEWAEAERRVWRMRGDTRRYPVLERVIDELGAELTRRIGQSFTMAELVEAYHHSEAWATQVAHEAAPEHPWAWELSLVADTAFNRLSRAARDYTP